MPRYKASETGNPPQRGGTEPRQGAKKSRGMRRKWKVAAVTSLRRRLRRGKRGMRVTQPFG